MAREVIDQAGQALNQVLQPASNCRIVTAACFRKSTTFPSRPRISLQKTKMSRINLPGKPGNCHRGKGGRCE
jgi:hypothetical protein